ncbi:MAG: FHA domain-containing protein [Planctomycetaceae bacterium]
MAVYLVPVGNGRRIVIDKAVLFVGRHPDCDVMINHSRKVSRKHCCLAQVNSDFYVRDLGSMNGVRVNGKRVKREVKLRLGDVLAIGDVQFILAVEERVQPKQPLANQQPSPSDLPRKRVSPPPDLDLSQDQPLPIPDEGLELADLIAQEDIDKLPSIDDDQLFDGDDAILLDQDDVT